MHVLGGDERAGNRPVCAGKNLDVGPVAEFADDAGVACRHRQGNVAGNRRDPQEVDLFLAAESEHDGGGIVLPGISVYDYFSRHGHACVPPWILALRTMICVHVRGKRLALIAHSYHIEARMLLGRSAKWSLDLTRTWE
ncbi:hypothetical protein D9M72_388990 [compost metagenome]